MSAERRGGAEGLCLVSASAGSGKTTRLTKEVTDSLNPASENCIDVPGLFAVTYTTKAQAELESRLRRALIERGDVVRAEELPLAYLGTVHAVCLRVLKEFALDIGLSPAIDGLPAEVARHSLQEALEEGLSESLRHRLVALSSNLELQKDNRTDRHDWITPVERIMTLARNNRIRPNALSQMATWSSDGLLTLLGPPLAEGAELEGALARAIAIARASLAGIPKPKKNTTDVMEVLRQAERSLDRDRLKWSDWAKLTKLAPEVQARPLVSEVQEVAAQYVVHPRFQREIRELCAAVFEAAQVGMDAYAEFKARRGLVDYVDMIDLALSALEDPAVCEVMQQRVQLLVVDEFQDTSPVQLALFTKLHALCRRSLWVGDRKQCIFEYAGADPTLMDAAAKWAAEEGGRTEVQGFNHRSRPELVEPTSELFVRAFASQGLRPDEVATRPAKQLNPAQHDLPAFGVFRLNAKRGADTAAIAEGVMRLLARPNDTPVVDRHSGDVRPLRPGDIAVLMASNNETLRLAEALAQRGVPTVLPRTGLMKTPEATLLTAALRFLVDPRDSVAAAEVDALLGFGGQTHEQWLSTRIRDRASDVKTPLSAALSQLWAERDLLVPLSPTEQLSRVIALLDLNALARSWPNPGQRAANLDALVALAAAYEDRATYLREAASLAGLLRYFEEAQIEVRREDEERASDEQHVSISADAVVLSTYHKAKGLEWPVVILGSLERPRKRDVFDVSPETEREVFDAREPLGGRWIRYWPWPLGSQRKGLLKDRAVNSAIGRAVARRDANERVRLLYVGFTRARDHLILAVPTDAKGKAKREWLDELADADGALLGLPDAEGPEAAISIRTAAGTTLRCPARTWSLSGDVPTVPVVAPAEATFWFAASIQQTAGRPPYRIQPSRAAESGLALGEASVVAVERFTHRMAFERPKGVGWDEIGTALHAFLAADRTEFDESRRRCLALELLSAAGIAEAFAATALIDASDALRGCIAGRWPNAVWHREVPVSAALNTPAGPRRIEGTIDLLLETSAGVVVVDHKSFPGGSQAWNEQALKHAPQLFIYGHALRATGHSVLAYLVHFTVGGGIVELAAAGQTSR